MTFLHNHAEAVIVIDFSVTVDVNINVLGILCELVKSPFAFFYYGIVQSSMISYRKLKK